jgi:hypothetical protein
MNNYQYRCVITDACGAANSNAATLTVFDMAIANVLPSTTTTINHPSTVALSATCPSGSQAVWFDSPTNPTNIGTGSPFNYTPPRPGTYTFYAICRRTSAPLCESTARVATGQVRYCGLTGGSLPNFNGVTETIKAATSITATNTISSTSQITYQAGTFVLLSPGFSIASGGKFTAQTGGCN